MGKYDKYSDNKYFWYTQALDEDVLQDGVFERCGVHDMVHSALDGYSATIFAYGQTGSGKTYTMSGIESWLGTDAWVSDETDGIIPWAVRYMWEEMTKRPQVYYVKAAFMEIYNE